MIASDLKRSAKMSKEAKRLFSITRSSKDYDVSSLDRLTKIADIHERAGFPPIPKETMHRRYWQYIRFLQVHGFTTRIIASSINEMSLDTKIKNSDLTDEGYRFMQYSHDKWISRTYKDQGEEKEEKMLLKWMDKFLLLRAMNA